MRAAGILAWSIVVVALTATGCNQNPFLTAQQQPAWQQQQQQVAQLQDLGRRATALDADNRDLHAELARSQQQVQLLQEEAGLLRRQLNETASQLRDIQLAKQDADRRVGAMEAAATRGGGATITANNSFTPSPSLVDIPGIEVRQDGDLLRMELPSDRLFHQGTAQLLPTASALLDQVAAVVSRHYPRQLVGIEGHTDSVPLATTSSHQLSAAQAVAVLDALVRRNRIPARQLFTLAHGANHPRVSNATPAGRSKNRRVEIVVYPETVDDAGTR